MRAPFVVANLVMTDPRNRHWSKPASPEQALIQDIFAPLTRAGDGAAGLRDDACWLAPDAASGLVVTKDMIVAGVHFMADDSPDVIARKALRVNFSDLAAKGATPTGYLVGLAVRDTGDRAWFEQFASGLERDQEEYNCVLLGGDTVSTPGPVTVSITAFGVIAGRHMVRRGGGRAGDIIYISGSIGDAALGLVLRRDGDAPWAGQLTIDQREFLLDRYAVPQPRVGLASAVAGFANASMDVSDGFTGDLSALCWASGLGAEVMTGDIPLSPAARCVFEEDADMLEPMLGGGDDYEVIACVEASKANAFETVAADGGVVVRRVGRLTDAHRDLRFFGPKGVPVNIAPSSYSHF